MFSGIIETLGTINHVKYMPNLLQLNISPPHPFPDLAIGESIAVNGACLTVTDFNQDNFDVTVVPETLRLINHEQLTVGNLVNLERALPANGRIGGHYVQGHVDATGQIIAIDADGEDALIVKFTIPPHLSKYIVNKGYIALDGMSITIIETTPDWFTVTLIPHTLQVTIAGQYQTGTTVNIEVDILSKYVEKILLHNQSVMP